MKLPKTTFAHAKLWIKSNHIGSIIIKGLNCSEALKSFAWKLRFKFSRTAPNFHLDIFVNF